MKYLAIDYGQKHIGLAISEGILAEPFGQFDSEADDKTVAKIIKICQEEQIDELVLGISENQMAVKVKAFAQILSQNLTLKIHLQDETLSSQLAKKHLLESGAKRKKRQTQNHQIAAAIILQEFLDNR
ncbi:Holliday junction resolvase RuvX [Candidatus Beckwithbacteria bacterium]|nr:Holliday junction resolvase RuvX [Candidatus Beckwithbacteria bacterium]